MTDKPLLLLSYPVPARVPPGPPAHPNLHLPDPGRQYDRTVPLLRALQASAATLTATAAGSPPEYMVVLEIYGSVTDFRKAVNRTQGMDWICERDLEHLDPADDFFDLRKPDAKLTGRLFLVMSNQRATEQLIELHKRWKEIGDRAFSHGRTKWRDVFARLKTIRRWNAEDRLRETGLLEAWKENLSSARATIHFEAELVFRNDQIKRDRAYRNLSRSVQDAGGRCSSPVLHHQIAYHAVVIELPAGAVERLLEQVREGRLDEVVLFRSEEVLFFRPLGQSLPITKPPQGIERTPALKVDAPRPTGSPLVGVLDGQPMANHPALKDRLFIHDPDGFGESYTAAGMSHGSGMASLVVHGDLLGSHTSLSRPVYVRPIMRLDVTIPGCPREQVPADVLPADLMFRALKEMFDGSDETEPATPQVRIVNLSVGDPARQYDGYMSPWAKMLDWLAVKYHVLFIISAGNHTNSIDLSMSMAALKGLTPDQLEAEVLKVVAADVRKRRVLSPGESLNSVTAGAVHADSCAARACGTRQEAYVHALPAAYCAIGFGHLRMLKPDLYLPGGRQFFQATPVNGHVCLDWIDVPFQPGHCVPGPNGNAGARSPWTWTRGTSPAAALASHHAGLICENLIGLRDEPNGQIIEDNYLALFTKALLAHGAAWGESYDVLKATLKGEAKAATFDRQVARFLGYGVPDCDRAVRCTSSRATVLGRGSLKDGHAQRFDIPLPPSLGGKKVKQRLVVTLAWFSPINPEHRSYRKACLWFEKPMGKLMLTSQDADYHASSRGTLQHVVFEGEGAVPIVDSDLLSVQVNCCADAGKLTECIPYAIAVTLEVIGAPEVRVYDEMRDALLVKAGLRARV